MLKRPVGFLFASVATQGVAIVLGIVMARTLGPSGKSVIAYAGIGLSMVLTATESLTTSILTQYGRDKISLQIVHKALLRVVFVLGVPTALIIAAIGVLYPSQRPLIGAACVVPFAMYVQGAQGILLSAGAARAMIVQGALNTIVFGIILMPLLIFTHFTAYASLGLWMFGWIASSSYAFFALRRLPQEPSYDSIRRDPPDDGAPTPACFGERCRYTSRFYQSTRRRVHSERATWSA